MKKQVFVLHVCLSAGCSVASVCQPLSLAAILAHFLRSPGHEAQSLDSGQANNTGGEITPKTIHFHFNHLERHSITTAKYVQFDRKDTPTPKTLNNQR